MVKRIKVSVVLIACGAAWCVGASTRTMHAADEGLVQKVLDVKTIAPTSKAGAALVECIQATISPNDWEKAGGSAEIKFQRGDLAIHAPNAIHAKIEKLVATLGGLPASGTKEASVTPKTPRHTIQEAEKDSDSIVAVYPIGDLLKGFGSSFDMESFLELVSIAVQPSSWDAVGGDGHLAEFGPRGVLVVGQSKQAIEHLDAFFAALRKAPVVDNKLLAKPPKEPVIAAGSYQLNGVKLTTIVYPVADLVSNGRSVWRRPDGSQNFECDHLIEIVTSFAEPTTWDSVGGNGSVKEFESRLALVVSQTAETHKQIESLFAALRKIPHFPAKDKKTAPQPPVVVGAIKNGDDELHVVVYDVGAKVLRPKDEEDFFALIEALYEIDSSSWDTNGGRGRAIEYAWRGALVVSNTKENHALITKAIENFKLPKE